MAVEVPTRGLLSGSTDGKPIVVAATSTPGTTVHAAGADGYDAVWLWASNLSAGAIVLTMEWGNSANQWLVSVPAQSIAEVSTGLPIQNSLTIAAFAGTTNVITLNGYVVHVE